MNGNGRTTLTTGGTEGDLREYTEKEISSGSGHANAGMTRAYLL
jgi:hypothetical protein